MEKLKYRIPEIRAGCNADFLIIDLEDWNNFKKTIETRFDNAVKEPSDEMDKLDKLHNLVEEIIGALEDE